MCWNKSNQMMIYGGSPIKVQNFNNKSSYVIATSTFTVSQLYKKFKEIYLVYQEKLGGINLIVPQSKNAWEC